MLINTIIFKYYQGTTPQYTQMIYLIDSQIPQVLACVNLTGTLPFKIKYIKNNSNGY